MIQGRGRPVPAIRSALAGLGFLATGLTAGLLAGASPAAAQPAPSVQSAQSVPSAQPASGGALTAAQKAEMGGVIRDYLLQNPEVLQDAMAELERRQKTQDEAKRSQVVDTNAGTLFNAPGDVVLGNPKGRVTLVEFFDYNCGYCKRSLDDIAKLLKAEPDMKLVLKDFPVLGPGSVEAAYVALAARNQLKGDQFWQFHQKLLGGQHGPVGKAQALAVAKDMGANMDQLQKDAAGAEAKGVLQNTMQVADALSLTGTPSFVVGHEVVVGAVGFDELKSRVDNVLKCGKAACS